jgi:hypothetical protein
MLDSEGTETPGNLCNNQQNAHFLHCFNLIMVSSTCFEHPSVHSPEDLYIEFYGILFHFHRWVDIYLPMKMEQSVLKRCHINFRCQWTIQTKAYKMYIMLCFTLCYGQQIHIYCPAFKSQCSCSWPQLHSFYISMPLLKQDSVFPFIHEESHSTWQWTSCSASKSNMIMWYSAPNGKY